MLKEIANRKSCRKFNDKHVDDEQVIQLLESAVRAPSGMNTQPWNFIIVRDEETKARIAKANNNQEWMNKASVFVACVADIRVRIKDGRELHLDENSDLPELKLVLRDTAIASGYLLLEAEHMGLAACWTSWFNQADMRPLLNVPSDKYVLSVIAIGYTDERKDPTPRKPLADKVRHEKW